MSDLPGILATIATVTDEATALKLVQALGGTSLKLSAAPDGKLATVVGVEAAEKIVKEFIQGDTVVIPMANRRGAGARRAAVARMLIDGGKIHTTALACDVHERTAKRMRARLKDQEDLPLFKKRD